MKFLKVILATTLISSFCVNADVTIYKQWHLSPKQNTTNIALATKLPQFANQESIYLSVKKMISDGKSQLLIAEGCEGEINHDFKENFNGWDYTRLSILKNGADFDKILTLIPLKIEVLFEGKILTFCGDSKKLVNEHQLALSDLRAYYGYISRLNQFKGKDEKRYKEYSKALEVPQGQDAIVFAKEKGKAALQKFKDLIVKRNDSFIEMSIKNQDKNPMIIIGGLHAEDLEKRLKEKNIKVSIIEDETYAKEEKGLFTQLEAAFK